MIIFILSSTNFLFNQFCSIRSVFIPVSTIKSKSHPLIVYHLTTKPKNVSFIDAFSSHTQILCGIPWFFFANIEFKKVICKGKVVVVHLAAHCSVFSKEVVVVFEERTDSCILQKKIRHFSYFAN